MKHGKDGIANLTVLSQTSDSVCRKRCLHLLGSIAILLLCSTLATAQGPKPPVPKPEPKAQSAPAPGSTAHQMSPEDVSAFLDGIMPQQLAREDIAGAVISIVKDGRVIFAKGYGYADVEKKKPVSPEDTLFRPGSISKLFTWTSVMQLVEQGKLDLDRDVNDYLDFKVPATFPKPITLRNIMTHTPGFEESVQELFVGDAKDLQPLNSYLQIHMPTRIFPPGETPAYSNYATTMAGYIVQRISGQDYFDYVEAHVIKPLGMTHSTFRQPLPDTLAPLMSKGYVVASQPAKKFEFVEAAPAGSSSVSAMDMTHFMMAHLQDGKYENVQILKPETAQLMHSRQFANMPEMNAMCLGFYEETRNGHRIIGHAGDTDYFHSDLHLMPDAQLGFFISYNSAGKGEISAREAVWHAFLDRYFPIELKDTSPVPTAAQDAAEISGHYIVSRRSQDNILSAITPVGETKFFRNDDGTISSKDLKNLNGEPKKFREISPMIFRDVDDQDRVAFKRDDSGNNVAVIDFPFMVFQKASAWENSAFQLPLIIASLAIIVLAVVLWPIAALIRRHYAKPLTLTPQEKRLRLLVRLTCVAFILFFLGFVIFFSIGLKDIGLLSPKGNPWLRLIQLFGWLAVLGTLIAIYNAVQSLQDRALWLWSKIGDTLIALSCVGALCFIFTWHLLHWSLKY